MMGKIELHSKWSALTQLEIQCGSVALSGAGSFRRRHVSRLFPPTLTMLPIASSVEGQPRGACM